MRIVRIILLCVLFPIFGYSQFVEKDKAPNPTQKDKTTAYRESRGLKDKLVYGGSFGGSFGSEASRFNIAPLVGYRLTPLFTLGVGFSYSYLKWRGQVEPYRNYGYSLWAQFALTDYLYAYTSVENVTYYQYDAISRKRVLDRKWKEGFFVGIGYYQSITDYVGLQILGAYNFTYDQSLPIYTSPFIFRINIVAGGFGI